LNFAKGAVAVMDRGYIDCCPALYYSQPLWTRRNAERQEYNLLSLRYIPVREYNGAVSLGYNGVDIFSPFLAGGMKSSTAKSMTTTSTLERKETTEEFRSVNNLCTVCPVQPV
jgi:hypothetical protein